MADKLNLSHCYIDQPLNSSTLYDYFGSKFSSVHGYLSLAVCLFGFLSNFANIIVLTRPTMRSVTNMILVWLAVADLMTMIFYIPSLIKFYILKEKPGYQMVTGNLVWIRYQIFAISFLVICHAIAVWLTVLLATVRLIHIGFPSSGPAFADQIFTNRCITAIVLTCNVVAVPNWLINKGVHCILDVKHGSKYSSVKNPVEFMYQISEDQNYIHLEKLNFWLQAVFFKMVPSIVLAILTILLVVEVRNAGRRREALIGSRIDRRSRQAENRTTFMLMAVVLLFLLIETPQGIMMIASYFNADFYENIYKKLGDFIDFLTLINEATNFLLYTSMSKQFRIVFSSLFCLCSPSRDEKLNTSQLANNGRMPLNPTT